MRVKAIWILCALVFCGFGLVATGCSDDDGGSTTVSTTENGTDEDMTEGTTDEDMTEGTTDEDMMEGATDEGVTDDESSDSDSTDTSIAEFATSENCQKFLEASQQYSDALSGSADADFQAIADAFDEYADAAPEEISEDFRTLGDYYVKVSEALEGYDPNSGGVPSAEAIAGLQRLATEIDMSKVAEASSNISTWVTQNCTGAGG